MSSHSSLDPESVSRLAEVFQSAQRFGWVGQASIASIIDQAAVYVRAVALSRLSRIVELGSGGGVPGLIVAMSLPDVVLVCVEADQRRADQLWWAINFLELVSQN